MALRNQAIEELFHLIKSLSYLRTAGQLLVILAACVVVCWAFSLYGRSSAALITGQVIDWKTGQPAPYTDVRLDELNSSGVVARTDARGRFSFQPQDSPRVYFLFAAPPRYGTLLQATFGQRIVMYRKSQRVRDIVIPAIPGTELSGHIYGSDGKPIHGCNVSALTRTSRFDISTDLQVRGWHSVLPYDLAEADDPNKLIEVESAETDVDGMYIFRRLGADRYFVLARCNETQTSQKSARSTWVPMLYADVNSITSAQQILLLPGNHRAGIDFHMQRKRASRLEGTIIFSDHSAPKPWPEAIYLQDLVVVRSDHGLTSTWLGWEPCQINANAGTFRCDSLVPGEYTFYFEIEPGLGAARNLRTQAAKVRCYVQAAAKQVLTVQLHNIAGGGVLSQRPYTGPGGILDFGNICATASDGRPAIQVLAWGQGRASGACYYMSFWGNAKLRLPKDYYSVSAFEAAFVARNHSYLGDSSKFEGVLMQRGTRVKLDVGQTIKPSLPVLTTAQLINIGLTSLRAAP